MEVKLCKWTLKWRARFVSGQESGDKHCTWTRKWGGQGSGEDVEVKGQAVINIVLIIAIL